MTAKAKGKSKSQTNQDIYHKWQEAHPDQDLDLRLVAPWAIAQGLWVEPPYDPVKACAKELSRAVREEQFVDPQNRTVRRWHSYSYTDETGQKRWMFADILTATPAKMQMSLQYRRRSALGDVIQMDRDRQSYNDNNPFGAYIQMSFNFDEDLKDMQHSSEYPDAPPEA